MSVSSSGIGSGIDIKELVSNMIDAESHDKKVKFTADEASATAKISAYGDLKIAMSELQGSLKKWQNGELVSKTVNVALSDDQELVSASASQNAVNGQYQLQVQQLATALKLGSQTNFDSTTSVVGSGTLIFQFSDKQFSVSIDESNHTLVGIADTVNASSDRTGVKASLITGSEGVKIIFSSVKTGLENAFSVIVEDGDDSNDDNNGLSRLASVNLNELQSASDAQLTIDGIQVTSASNQVTSALSGVTINLHIAKPGSSVALTVANNIANTKDNIKRFVEQTNSLITIMSKMSAYGGDHQSSGVLIGDATLRNFESQLKRQLIPNGGYQVSLSSLGITTDQKTGKLVLDEQKMSEVIDNSYSTYTKLLIDEEIGIFHKVESLLSSYLKNKGTLDSRIQGLTNSIEVVAEEREKLERRLLQMEKRLIAQFIAMDKTVAKLRSVSDFLTTQLDNLPKPLSTK